MTSRLAAACAVLLLAGCTAPDGSIPIYVGENRVGQLRGPTDGTAAGGAAGGATECQRLASRAVDASLTVEQRRAASDYGASIGC